jgi:hypothetical protein
MAVHGDTMDGAIETRPLPPPAPRRHPHDRRRENARKHGLYSAEAVVAGEDPGEFRRFRETVLAVYRPRDDGEIWIVAGMAETMWRIRRARRVEGRLWDGDGSEPEAGRAIEARWAKAIDSSEMRSVLRIEGHLDRRFSRALLDLERHRRLIARRHEAPPPPTAPAGNARESDNDQDVELADGIGDEDIGASRNPAAVGTSAPMSAPVAFEPPAAPAAFAAAPGAPPTDDPFAPRDVEREVPSAPPADPATRADFVSLARARLPVVRRAIDRLGTETADAYREALDLLGDDMRRWWEMRVTRAPGVRETWRDVSRRHPFWENNRTPRALRDWLTEIARDDRLLLEEVETERRSHL